MTDIDEVSTDAPPGVGPRPVESSEEEIEYPVSRVRNGWERGGGWFRDRALGIMQPEALITLVVVIVCMVFVFVELKPSLIFANTTAAGGDMGAHVWYPEYIKRVLMPSGHLFGWTQDYYDGMPAVTFYFPLPMYAIALLSYLLPYNEAFKVVASSGLVFLPLGAYVFGRLNRVRFPVPAALAAGSLPFIFSREFTIYGGNIASTMAGEFCFAISLTFALIFLGLVGYGLDTGKHRALAAVALACTAFSHVLPTIFASVGAIILILMALARTRDWRSVLSWSVPSLVVGGLLTAWWTIPFEYRLPYASNMGYQKVTNYLGSLFPTGDLWLVAMAAVGAALCLARANRAGTFLTIMAVLCGLVFRYAPQARLWNARVLPFWFLCLYLLAALALAEAYAIASERWTRDPLALRAALLPGALVVLILALVWTAFPLRLLPGGHVLSNGNYSWLGISSKDNSFIPDWVEWNYSGYQGTDKSRRQEYFALVAEMKKLGQQYGCGQADWEYESELNNMGTPDALMLLPYWTNGCIGSMEGLYYESSATTPYHFLDESELALRPSNPMRGLPYGSLDIAEGIQHLQMLGVKYYMALTPEAQSQAAADPSLRLVGTVGPYAVTYSNTAGNGPNGTLERTWKIYEIEDAPVVHGLVNQPVVVKGVAAGGTTWQNQMVNWWMNPSDWSVYEAAAGPSSWKRVAQGTSTLPKTPEPPVQVTNIKKGEQTIDFNVSQVGVPVVVTTSYFPNWKVSGAKGPYRVSPNLMVVIPTSTHVHLYYGLTNLDLFDFVLTGIGILGLIWLLFHPSVVAAPGRHFRRGVGGEGEGPEDEDGDGATGPLGLDTGVARPASEATIPVGYAGNGHGSWGDPAAGGPPAGASLPSPGWPASEGPEGGVAPGGPADAGEVSRAAGASGEAGRAAGASGVPDQGPAPSGADPGAYRPVVGYASGPDEPLAGPGDRTESARPEAAPTRVWGPLAGAEPAVTEPAVTEPVGTEQSSATEPVGTEPVGTEQSSATEPVGTEQSSATERPAGETVEGSPVAASEVAPEHHLEVPPAGESPSSSEA
jgi:hypothetical protein